MYSQTMLTGSPPAFVGLLADPLRWKLLRELAHSDRRVRELVEAVGQPQNLVSYHLGRLRAAGLVVARRSSHDGRDTYYHLDLERCVEAWAAVGAALHPSLGPAAPPRPARRWVLFVCTGNSARSPMAEALLRHRAGDRVQVASAGSHPRPLHPNAVQALAGYGITLTHRPTHLDAVREQRFHLVISLCDRVRALNPDFPGSPIMIHWSLPDPAADSTYPAFERLAAELDRRIRFLLPTLTSEE